jgi:hypothetical protein
MNKIINTLKSYLELEDNWDSYGGIAPTKEVVEISIDFIKKINNKNNVLPTPMVSGSGEVGLYWDNSLSDIYIEVGFEVGFEVEKEFSYFIANAELEIGEDDCNINQIPLALTKHINEFYK